MTFDLPQLIDDFQTVHSDWRRDFYGDDEALSKEVGQRFSTAFDRLFNELIKSGPTSYRDQLFYAEIKLDKPCITVENDVSTTHFRATQIE